MIPVSALSAWTHCPRQFYRSYVLKIKEPPNAAMILGLLKHKLHEKMNEEDARAFSQITNTDDLHVYLATRYQPILMRVVGIYRRSLHATNISTKKAYDEAKTIFDAEITHRVKQAGELLQQGLQGRELWAAITPKIKAEYGVKDVELKLKGRIDKLEVHADQLIPVELKSGKAPEQGVWPGHRIQAAAYALLLEKQVGTHIQQSTVHYIDAKQKRTIIINPFMKEEVLKTLDKVKETLKTKEVPKGCGRERCRACADNAVFDNNK